jgi:hypothetical protein
MKGILINDNNDPQINVRRAGNGKITGGLIIGDRLIQDAYITLSVKQGEIKEDPICGAKLVTLMRGKLDVEKIRKTIEIALLRVRISFDDIKNQLDTIINKISIYEK